MLPVFDWHRFVGVGVEGQKSGGKEGRLLPLYTEINAERISAYMSHSLIHTEQKFVPV